MERHSDSKETGTEKVDETFVSLKWVTKKREREITNGCGRDRERTSKQSGEQKKHSASKQPEKRLSSVLHGQSTNALRFNFVFIKNRVKLIHNNSLYQKYINGSMTTWNRESTYNIKYVHFVFIKSLYTQKFSPKHERNVDRTLWLCRLQSHNVIPKVSGCCWPIGWSPCDVQSVLKCYVLMCL